MWNIAAHSVLYDGLILLNSAGDAFTIVAYSIKVGGPLLAINNKLWCKICKQGKIILKVGGLLESAGYAILV